MTAKKSIPPSATRFRIVLIFIVLSLCGSPAACLEKNLQTEIVQLTQTRPRHIAVKVQMRFQGIAFPGEEFFFPETEWFTYSSFRGKVGGEALQFSHQQAPAGYQYSVDDDTYPSILTFSTQEFHVDPHFDFDYEFATPFYGPGTKTNEPTGYYVEYTLRSGRRWSTHVRDLTVEFQTAPTECSRILLLAGGLEGACVAPHLWRAQHVNMPLDHNVRLLLPP